MPKSMPEARARQTIAVLAGNTLIYLGRRIVPLRYTAMEKDLIKSRFNDIWPLYQGVEQLVCSMRANRNGQDDTRADTLLEIVNWC
jgi:hypothetical protein